MFRPLGALLFGFLGDRFGRRIPLMVDIIFYLCDGTADRVLAEFHVFLILRALFGIGMGGEWGLGASLVMETFPPTLAASSPESCSKVTPSDFCWPAIVYWLVFPHFGWRGLFVAGALPALLVIFIRTQVPESPVWQRAPSGTARDASQPGRRHPAARRLVSLRVLLMTAFNYMSHGTQDLYPTFLEKQRGFDVAQTSSMTIIYTLGAICGGTMCGSLSQRWGRRRCIILSATCGMLLIPRGSSPRDGSAHRRRIPDAVHGARRLGRGAGASQRIVASGDARHVSRVGLSARQLCGRLCGPSSGEARGAFSDRGWKSELRADHGIGRLVVFVAIIILAAAGPEARGKEF